jgi:hypothetical protein
LHYPARTLLPCSQLWRGKDGNADGADGDESGSTLRPPKSRRVSASCSSGGPPPLTAGGEDDLAVIAELQKRKGTKVQQPSVTNFFLKASLVADFKQDWSTACAVAGLSTVQVRGCRPGHRPRPRSRPRPCPRLCPQPSPRQRPNAPPPSSPPQTAHPAFDALFRRYQGAGVPSRSNVAQKRIPDAGAAAKATSLAALRKAVHFQVGFDGAKHANEDGTKMIGVTANLPVGGSVYMGTINTHDETLDASRWGTLRSALYICIQPRAFTPPQRCPLLPSPPGTTRS